MISGDFPQAVWCHGLRIEEAHERGMGLKRRRHTNGNATVRLTPGTQRALGDGGGAEEETGGSRAVGGRGEDAQLLFGRGLGWRGSGTRPSEVKQLLDVLEVGAERPG